MVDGTASWRRGAGLSTTTCQCKQWRSLWRDQREAGGQPLYRDEYGDPQYTGWTGFDCSTPICVNAQNFTLNTKIGRLRLGGRDPANPNELEKCVFNVTGTDTFVPGRGGCYYTLYPRYRNIAAYGILYENEPTNNLFGQEPRDSKKDQLTQFHMDIAASIQKVTEEIMIKLVRSLKEEFNIPNLCLAGGVALNCVANGKILQEKIFEKIWVQPAAGDAGGSLGATLALFHVEQDNPRIVNPNDDMNGSYLGPEYSQQEIEKKLKEIGAKFEVKNEDQIIDLTAEAISQGNAIGWFQGRMEFGPRALGGRSILGDPRSPEMQKNLNLKVKYRESFRPFAPSILRDDLDDWFDITVDSPYMLMVANINKDKMIKMNDAQKKLFGIEKLNIKRSEIPAVTHVDYSARIQTVHKETNERYFKLIQKFKEKTNCPVIVNTSFNVRGEPIVNTPLDAFNCFMSTGLDKLVIGNCYLSKKDQDKNLKKDYSKEFELD